MNKLISWNVNGLRAVAKNGFLKWFEAERADWVCLQEIKVTPEQLMSDPATQILSQPKGYHALFNPAQKLGYSGTAIYSREEPREVRYGLGDEEADAEGRVITAEYKRFTLVNAYFPNSQRDHARLPFKLRFCTLMLKHCEAIRKSGKPVLLCGDYNIAHRAIDLKNPKSNENNAGFLPEERAWMDQFLSSGYVDTFRHFNAQPDHYTWWSYRPGVREKNIGWRLDYFCANEEFKDELKEVIHLSQIKGSDHCPVSLRLHD